MINWSTFGTWTLKNRYKLTRNIPGLYIRSSFIHWATVLLPARTIKRSNFMIFGLSTWFRSTRGTRDQSKVLIFILTVLIWSAHHKTEQPKYGTVKREGFNTLFNHTQIPPSLVGRATILSQEGLIRWSMFGKLVFTIVWNKKSTAVIIRSASIARGSSPIQNNRYQTKTSNK
jgi:hypothetical protein